MADKDLLIREEVEFNGVFSFDEAYAYAFNWFRDESYGLVEDRYSEKVTSGGRDIKFEWSATKRKSDYFKVELNVKVEVLGLTDVEVEADGKKKKSNKGKFKFAIKGFLVKDPDSKWDETPWYQFLRNTYNKYIIPGRIDKMEDSVFDDVQDCKEKMKLFFEISGKR
jgi:hypothetical protein